VWLGLQRSLGRRRHEDHDLGIGASAVDERATLRINIWESPLI